MQLCLLPLFMTLFVFPFVLPLKVSEGITCLTGCASSFFYQPASSNLTVTFTEKSDGDISFFPKNSLVVSLVSMITILVKLSCKQYCGVIVCFSGTYNSSC